MFSAVWLSMALGLTAPASGAPALSPIVTTASAGLLPTPQFRRYDTADGLPSSIVYAVAQDRDGAMWFGTKSGIARYDGVDFKVFRHVAGDADSLYENGIASLLFDRDGKLWAGGLEAGLNRYDPDTGKFTHWDHNPQDPSSLSSDKVWAIAQSADGKLWVGTVRGLDVMHPGGHGFEHVTDPLLGSTPAAFGLVAALHADARQQLWIGTSQGVFRRDPAGHLHRVSQLGSSAPIDAWSIDSQDGEVRIATAMGLLLVGNDDVARPLVGAGAPQGNVLSSVRDRSGRLWAGTQHGLFMQEQPGKPVLAVTDQPVLRGDLPGTWVWSMLVDHEGGLWVTLVDGGVGYLAPDWKDTSRFTHIPDDPGSLRDSIVTAMARGHDGRVWVGERDGRIDKLDPHTGKVQHVLSGLRGDVLGMTQDAHERLWITVRGGLYRYTEGKPPEQADPHNLLLKHPLEVEQGPDERMYVRTFGEGLFRVDPETLAVTRVPMDESNQKVLWGSQLTRHDDMFWYASDGGMLRLDAQHHRFEAIPGVRQDRPVNAFDFTSDGLWMARPDGLEHYHYAGDGIGARPYRRRCAGMAVHHRGRSARRCTAAHLDVWSRRPVALRSAARPLPGVRIAEWPGQWGIFPRLRADARWQSVCAYARWRGGFQSGPDARPYRRVAAADQRHQRASRGQAARVADGREAGPAGVAGSGFQCIGAAVFLHRSGIEPLPVPAARLRHDVGGHRRPRRTGFRGTGCG